MEHKASVDPSYSESIQNLSCTLMTFLPVNTSCLKKLSCTLFNLLNKLIIFTKEDADQRRIGCKKRGWSTASVTNFDVWLDINIDALLLMLMNKVQGNSWRKKKWQNSSKWSLWKIVGWNGRFNDEKFHPLLHPVLLDLPSWPYLDFSNYATVHACTACIKIYFDKTFTWKQNALADHCMQTWWQNCVGLRLQNSVCTGIGIILVQHKCVQTNFRGQFVTDRFKVILYKWERDFYCSRVWNKLLWQNQSMAL